MKLTWGRQMESLCCPAILFSYRKMTINEELREKIDKLNHTFYTYQVDIYSRAKKCFNLTDLNKMTKADLVALILIREAYMYDIINEYQKILEGKK